jgi:hypothetical protein
MNCIPKIPFLKKTIIIFRKKSILQQNIPFLFLVFIFLAKFCTQKNAGSGYFKPSRTGSFHERMDASLVSSLSFSSFLKTMDIFSKGTMKYSNKSSFWKSESFGSIF